MTTLEIKGMPMPPSQNQAYANSFNGSGRGRYKTQAYKTYEQEMEYWSHKNNYILDMARRMCSSLQIGEAIQIDATFNFMEHKIITKKNEPKKNDSSNRLKILHDVIAHHLGIDDKYFWDGSFRKRAIKIAGMQDYCDVTLSIISID